MLVRTMLSPRVLLTFKMTVLPSWLSTIRLGYHWELIATRQYLATVSIISANAIVFSIRISSNKTYSGGLFIADFIAMPHGCSIWGAYWSVGPNWPNGGMSPPSFIGRFSHRVTGEIDLVEGVNLQATNQYTVHTGPNCNLTTQDLPVTGDIGNLDCASGPNGNSGCYFTDTDTTSYGTGFNLVAGGVFAHQWDQNGIKIWHFPRTAIPSDITEQNPNPSGWGDPVAYWSASSCDMASHFSEHTLVLDITLCGDWAKPAYSGSGCPGTCAEAVMDPNNFACMFHVFLTALFSHQFLDSCQMENQLHRCLPVNRI